MGRKRVCALLMLLAIVLTLGACGNSQEQAYKKAGKLLDDGKYAEALEKFKALGSYEDASKMALYAQALDAAANGNYDAALKTFRSLDAFKDSPIQISYWQARQAEDAGDYETAMNLYDQIPLFLDSQARCDEILLRAYDEIGGISFFSDEEIVPVWKNGKWGYIDSTGKLVTPCEWDDAGYFYEGFACVKEEEKWGYIDTTGKLVIPCEWDWSAAFDNGLTWVEKDRKWGCIDTTGKIVVPCELDHVYYGEFDGLHNGLTLVGKDGKWGCIDATGKFVAPCDCSYSELVLTGAHVFALRDGYLTIYDLEGKRVF